MGTAEAIERDVVGEGDRDWLRAHAALTRLARERAAADAEEGRWLLLAYRSGAHVHLGLGSFSEYVERLFGYSPRATREKLRVAEALEGLPLSAEALEQGALSWCAARELTRVANADTERAWLDAACGKTTRQLEQLVVGKRPGELPPSDPRGLDLLPPRLHVLRFEVAPETFATFREAMSCLRRAAGGRLDDDSLLLEMARHVLGAPPDAGRSSYRVSYDLCPGCGRGGQVAGGELVPVGSEVLAMAACDGERIGLHAPPANENHRANESELSTGLDSRATHVGRESLRRTVADEHALAGVDSADSHRAKEGVLGSESDLRTALMGSDSLHHDASHLCRTVADEQAPVRVDGSDPRCTDESALGAEPDSRASHEGRDGDAVQPSRQDLEDERLRPRARQAVPPALRRAVLARDRCACQVPGCRNTLFVDVHHIRPRSEGGRNRLRNLITLCTAHHRATHRGELVIEGTADEPRFFHADGTAYGQAVTARRVDGYGKVFAALRHLGFRERDARAVLAELRAEPALREASTALLLREALQRIRPVR